MDKRLALVVWAILPWVVSAQSPNLAIRSSEGGGAITWTSAYSTGICTIESAASPQGPWSPRVNVFTTNSTGGVTLAMPSNQQYFRLLTVDISAATKKGFESLVASYGVLSTIAGNGLGNVNGTNFWQSEFEGGPATNAALSGPHIALADVAGNVFIVDKGSHSVFKVDTNGNLHTVLGTHFPGNGPNKPAYGTNVALNSPNGLWVRQDGTIYVLDTDNGKVRKLLPQGIAMTMLEVGFKVSGGRGLWVSDDEQLVYLANRTNVLRWVPDSGWSVYCGGFVGLGNLVVDPSGNLVVTDQDANLVYRVSPDGNKTIIAGNGSTQSITDGARAIESGLDGVRGVWFLPNNGYFLATQAGSQISYVDPRGRIYVFLDGATGAHAGDGQWFYTHGNKISEARSVTLDRDGNILVVENDAGYVRRIRFLRQVP